MEKQLTRRGFLGGPAVATAAFTIIKPQLVRGSGNEKIKAGLIGCGFRGTQAVLDNLNGCENVELVAMADAFQDQLDQSLAKLRKSKFGSRIKVDPEHRFIGLDAYRKVMAMDVDLVMLATHRVSGRFISKPRWRRRNISSARSLSVRMRSRCAGSWLPPRNRKR